MAAKQIIADMSAELDIFDQHFKKVFQEWVMLVSVVSRHTKDVREEQRNLSPGDKDALGDDIANFFKISDIVTKASIDRPFVDVSNNLNQLYRIRKTSVTSVQEMELEELKKLVEEKKLEMEKKKIDNKLDSLKL